MVSDKLHIICGNCGQYMDLSLNNGWTYIPEEKDSDEIVQKEDVQIYCENCGTIHSLNKYVKNENELL